MLDNNDILKGSGKKIYSPRITKKQLKCVEMLIKGEQTRTDIAKELGILAVVILIRALLALLIHWEIKTEKMETPEKNIKI